MPLCLFVFLHFVHILIFLLLSYSKHKICIKYFLTNLEVMSVMVSNTNKNNAWGTVRPFVSQLFLQMSYTSTNPVSVSSVKISREEFLIQFVKMIPTASPIPLDPRLWCTVVFQVIQDDKQDLSPLTLRCWIPLLSCGLVCNISFRAVIFDSPEQLYSNITCT